MDIPEILKQLEVNEGTFPREAVAQAIAQHEAMTPELLRLLEYAHQNIEDIAERPDYFAHIYAMYLLAQFRERRAYPLIFDFFSMHGEMAVETTGDVATEGLGRILASVSCGDTSLMTSLVENEQANEYVRNAALRGLVTLVACGERSREEIITYFQSLFRGKIARDACFVWSGLVASSTDLYPEEVYADIKQAYDDDLVESFHIQLEDVDETLGYGKEQVLNKLRNSTRYSLIQDTIREMEWWACFQPQDRAAHNVVPAVQPRTVTPAVQPSTKKPRQKAKDKRKRKLAKASRRKNRR